ncbi:MAG: hypothetical protein ACJAQ3_002305, partial [Planctomycetota bacterium]
MAVTGRTVRSESFERVYSKGSPVLTLITVSSGTPAIFSGP